MFYGSLIVALFLTLTSAIASQPQAWQMGLQSAATPVMENIAYVHNILLGVIFTIGFMVIALVAYAVYRFRESRNPTPSKRSHHTLLEIVWTLVPALILIMVGIPSIRILYKNDKAVEPEITIKAIGHQWYWSYEIKHGEKQLSFDSYMIETQDLKPGQLRNLEVDNRVLVPKDATVQLLTTSADVLHSFAIPSFGIKKDSVPGRINETWFRVAKEGVYYGQCSELCGIRHGFMPIVVEVTSRDKYEQWLHEKLKVNK
ncbi:MAG: cytochrome c oxidase subunit II [Alphaproteobacteria bacterium]